jgi:hypothetical protein
MATPIRLPLSPRQAEALSSLLETWLASGHRWQPLGGPDLAQALREVRDKLDNLREA